MSQRSVFLIAMLMVASIGIVPQAVAADDKWPGGYSCEDEAPVINEGTITGELGSNGDVDMFKIRLQEGQYLEINTEIAKDKPQEPQITFGTSQTSYQDIDWNDIEPRGIQRGTSEDFGSVISLDENSQSHSFEIWAITDRFSEDGLCISITDNGWETPYDWELTIERSDPDVTLFEVRELEDRVVELQNQLDESEGNNERISELESQLQQKNQRISELESLLAQKNQTINELESQSSDGSENDVTIDVTVNPAGGQQNFVESGEAVVQAESENADVSEMQVEYGAGTYQLDSSGEVAIPLAETGTQEMAVVYGDTTEQVSIEVQSQDNQNQQNQQDSGGTGASGPGFGIVVAVIALLGVGFLSTRYQ